MRMKFGGRGGSHRVRGLAICALVACVACSRGEESTTVAPAASPAVDPPAAVAPVPPAAVAPGGGAAGTAAAGESGAVEVAPDDEIVVFMDADVTEGPAPLTVTLEVELEGGAPPIQWRWDYGDGQTGDAAETTHQHTFTEPGTYRIELEVEDARGDTDFDLVDVIVGGP